MQEVGCRALKRLAKMYYLSQKYTINQNKVFFVLEYIILLLYFLTCNKIAIIFK